MRIWLAALALAACTTVDQPRAPASVATALALAPGEWTQLTPQAVEISGRLITATCSHAPGADPAFRFWAKRGVSDNLVIYFDGGGACWDDITCSVPLLAASSDPRDGFYKAEILPSDDPRRMAGLFDLANPRNPVRTWSFVFVPYCTGDVHSGSNTAHYTNPDTGESYVIEHRGADNFRVVLEWMRANFDAPQTILVAGSSAGAYGAAAHFARIREAFPNGRAVMLGDAGQGVTTSDFLPLRNGNWRFDLPVSVFGAHASLTPDDDVVDELAAHFPADRFAQYTTAHDRTQVAFLALMGGEGACSAWTDAALRGLSRRQRAANFRSYLAAGESHTILRSPLFYSEHSGGAPFPEWLEALIGESPPQSRACEHCLATPRSCPFGVETGRGD